MLSDMEFRHEPVLALFDMSSGAAHKEVYRLEEGVYQIDHHNGHLLIGEDRIDHSAAPPKEACEYGVCDDIGNLRETIEAYRADQRSWVIFMTKVVKADEPAEGGWRWRKWGPYIGRHERKADYIYDEPDIQWVFCFSAYCLTPAAVRGAP